MSTTHRLEIVIETNNAEQRLEKLRQALREAGDMSGKIAQATGQASKGLHDLGDAADDLVGSANKSKNAVDKLNNELEQTTHKAKQAANSANQLADTWGRLNGVLAAVGIGIGVSSIIDTIDAMMSLDAQIKLVTTSEQQAAAVKQRLRELANAHTKDIEAMSSLYVDSAKALGQLGKTQSEVLKFTEAVSLAMATGGKSAESQSAAILQLGQAMQSGVLQGDEFKSIAENAPVLLDLISQKLNMTRGEVKELASDGKITAQVVYEALAGSSAQLQQVYDSMPTSIRGAMTVIQNEWKYMVEDVFTQTTGITGVVAEALLLVAKNFRDLAVIGVGVATAALAKYVTGMVAAQVATMSFSGAFAALRAVMMAHPLMFIAGVIMAVMTSVNGLDGTIKDLADTFRFVGVVIGDAIELLADIGSAAVSFFSDFLSNSETSTAGASEAFGGFFTGIDFSLKGMITLWARAWDTIIRVVRTAIKTAGSVIKYFSENTGKAFYGVWVSIQNFVKGIVNNTLVPAINYVIDVINGVTSQIGTIEIPGFGSFSIPKIDKVAPMAYSSGGIVKFASDAFAEHWIGTNDKIVEGYVGEAYHRATSSTQVNNSSLNSSVEGGGQPGNTPAGDSSDKKGKGKQEKSPKKTVERAKEKAQGYADNDAYKGLRIKNNDSSRYKYKSTVDTVEFAHIVQQALGKELIYFTAFNDPSHRGKNSRHNTGQAFDFTVRNQNKDALNKTTQQIKALAAQYGYDVGVLDEYQHPSKRSSGGHYHVTVRGRTGKSQVKELDTIKEQNQLFEDQLKIVSKYSDELTQMWQEYEKQKDEIKAKFLNADERNKYLEAAKKRYEANVRYYDLRVKYETEKHKLSGENALNAEHELNIAKLEADEKLSEELLKRYKLQEDEKHAYALQKFREEQRKKIQDVTKSINNMGGGVRDEWLHRYYEQTMSKGEFAQYNLNLEEDKKYSDLLANRDAAIASVNQVDNNGNAVFSEQEKNAMLLQVHEEFLASKAALEDLYANKRKQLEYENLMATVANYGNVFSSLTTMVEGYQGKQSAAYRTMFRITKAFQLAEVGMNVWKSASDAYRDKTGSVWEKMAAAAQAVVEQGKFVSLIQAVTPKGFATGGYTGNMGVNQVAGVVHGQEYVLNAQATKRIGVSNLNAMNNGGTIGSTNVVVNVAIHGDKDSSQTQSNSQDGMALGEALSAAIRKVILQEKRQGGLLA